ncbi:GTPase HflX [Massilimicrobiota timonensis]|uniref:GTPase HflX n=1 Tax=Massilimicrobiota timonensis TaxID=1776392 RepID=A0ABT7UK20_9FIRM|nr:GTPase HflX [Massilimicrobiota timonensis]MDM8196499.1 GTPase HflX [Massilimicrobiota timonensis]
MKGILVGVQYPQMTYDFDISMQELKQLAYACDIEVKAVVTQNLDTISPQYYIGKGKVMEIKELVEQDDIVIFNEELTPLQIKNLTDQCQVEVTDRSDLILRIFASRAKTKEAKLEVGIARLQYLLPRLAGMKQNLYSQQGGMGFRGSGEKQIELDRRRIRRQLTQAKRELAMIEKQRQTQRQLRKHHQEKVVCLVGYTNSGKSSLLNALTSKKVYEKDMLFATLQTSSRRVYMKKHHVIMSDTVGFIHQLPHSFVQSFHSTLEEVKDADLLIHVIDASSPYYHNQIETTLSVLKELDALDIPMIYVYNKMDLVHQPIVHEQGICIDVSVKEKKRLDDLENMIIDILFKDYELISVYIPYEEGHIFSEIEYQYEILHTEYLEKEIYVSFYVNQKHKQRYLPYIKKTDSLQ